jgi:hypothetical protein
MYLEIYSCSVVQAGLKMLDLSDQSSWDHRSTLPHLTDFYSLLLLDMTHTNKVQRKEGLLFFGDESKLQPFKPLIIVNSLWPPIYPQ